MIIDVFSHEKSIGMQSVDLVRKYTDGPVEAAEARSGNLMLITAVFSVVELNLISPQDVVR